jgi:hypothetical protein
VSKYNQRAIKSGRCKTGELIFLTGLGPITLESVTVLGTVLIIFSKTVKHVSSKACGEDIALIVALPSEEKMRKSDLVVTFGPYTRMVSNCVLEMGLIVLALKKSFE